mmetsp:Transcript_18481/g.46992  ORF Transcript_18481/g.46992 Transcript_18481/m.46992 type:complete len:336 (+) Transcript_18481:1115-2122(+)
MYVTRSLVGVARLNLEPALATLTGELAILDRFVAMSLGAGAWPCGRQCIRRRGALFPRAGACLIVLVRVLLRGIGRTGLRVTMLVARDRVSLGLVGLLLLFCLRLRSCIRIVVVFVVAGATLATGRGGTRVRRRRAPRRRVFIVATRVHVPMRGTDTANARHGRCECDLLIVEIRFSCARCTRPCGRSGFGSLALACAAPHLRLSTFTTCARRCACSGGVLTRPTRSALHHRLRNRRWRSALGQLALPSLLPFCTELFLLLHQEPGLLGFFGELFGLVRGDFGQLPRREWILPWTSAAALHRDLASSHGFGICGRFGCEVGVSFGELIAPCGRSQ